MITPPVIDNAHDAARVAEAVGAFIVILRDDDRVCDAFADLRVGVFAGSGPNPAVLRQLVTALGLECYQSWLPHFLGWDFMRAMAEEATKGPHALTIEVPGPDAPWAARGRAPKRGDVHREDIARAVSWFYRHHVKDPPDSIRSLAAEYAEGAKRESDARSMIQHGIARVRTLFACIEPPE